MAKFKGERENLWRQYNKAKLSENKIEIKIKIDSKTREINAYSNELKVCRRFMWRRGILKDEINLIRKENVIKKKIIERNTNIKSR